MYFIVSGTYFAQGKGNKITFCVDSVNYTDAEATSMTYLEEKSSNFMINSIRKASFSDVFIKQGEKYFLVRIKYINIEADGKERKRIERYLFQADSTDEAIVNAIEYSGQTLDDGFEIHSVTETPIMDVVRKPVE